MCVCRISIKISYLLTYFLTYITSHRVYITETPVDDMSLTDVNVYNKLSCRRHTARRSVLFCQVNFMRRLITL